VFLLPTLEGSWRAWKRRNSPEDTWPRRRSLPMRRTTWTDWTTPRHQISVVLARSTARGVVLRRGAKDSARLILWDTGTDEFVWGDSFKGYANGRQCDLSPEGARFVYFVRPHGWTSSGWLLPGWTAVCEPPDPTPLALWRKCDDSTGGGTFMESGLLRLHHSMSELEAVEGTAVEAEADNCQSDREAYCERLRQHGWIPRPGQDGSTQFPQLWQKQDQTGKYVLREYFNVSGDIRLEICLAAGHSAPRRLDAEWADWDQRNRLVAVRNTRLCAGRISDDGDVVWIKLEDFKKERTAGSTVRRNTSTQLS
jgi:hypothetical protein